MRSLLPLLLLLAASPGLAQDPAEADPPAEDLPILEGPQILEYVEAPYPEEARAEGLEGEVLLLVEIDEEGAVQGVEVLQPAGHGFDEAAVEAVGQMRFTPARTEAGPVPVAFEFTYGFTLRPEEPEEEAPPPVNLEGRIREMGTRRPVEGAKVVVDGTELVATTDAEGRFAIRGVPLGEQQVRILSPAHVTVEKTVRIEQDEVTGLELWARAETYRENEAIALYRPEQEEVTRRTITIDEVRRVPGTFGDPVRVVQTMPGAARSPFGTGLLVIRGSNPEDTAVYVDGVRIPLIYHLAGTTSVLAPDIIESVDYLPGSYGVEYGRSMGGVIDVKTRDTFPEHKLVAGADILDSQVYYEGTVGKHGVAIGARRSYIDVFLPLFLSGDFVIKPRYWDYQVKWSPQISGDRKLSAFVYGFNDLLLVHTPEEMAQGTDQDTQGDLKTEYLSHRGVILYRQRLGEHLTWSVTPSIGLDRTFFGLGDEFELDNRNWVWELRSELAWSPTPHLTLVPGFDLIGGSWSFDFASPFRFSDVADEDVTAEREPVSFDGRGIANAPDLYLEAHLRPLKDPERLLLTPGVRMNTLYFTYKGTIAGEGVAPWSRLSFDPRLSSRFEVVPGTVLKGGTGLYHQPPQPFESVGLGTEVTLGFERAWASSVGIEQRFTPFFEAELEVFYKDMENLVVFDESWGGFGSEPFENAGIGRSYGLEVIARHAPGGRFFGWVSYTLSRSIRKDRPEWDWYPFELDQTHIFSMQGGYDLPYDIGLSLQVQYVTGNPDTPYQNAIYDIDGGYHNPFRAGSYGGERLPPFFQTSFRVDRLWTFKSWQLLTYVDLLNAIRGVNPEFTTYEYDYTDSAYVRGLPFIPNVGFEARFWP